MKFAIGTQTALNYHLSLALTSMDVDLLLRRQPTPHVFTSADSHCNSKMNEMIQSQN